MIKITRVHPPVATAEPDLRVPDNQLVLRDITADYFVEATDDVTGERYRFSADEDGASCVFRYKTTSVKEVWEQIRATPALSRIARKVVREAMSSKN